MAREDENDFKKTKKCHICNKKYTETDLRERNHCHVGGKYRGSENQLCNKNFRPTDKILVICHNLRGCDSHFIMQEIGKFKQGINVIANNMENYIWLLCLVNI